MSARARPATMRRTMQALSWYDELERIAGKATTLPPHARQAVKRVVVVILSEGEKSPAGLEQMLAALADD
jgi:hypothetical protein